MDFKAFKNIKEKLCPLKIKLKWPRIHFNPSRIYFIDIVKIALLS